MATCEYEVLRQQKIADNRKRMEQLGLQQVLAVAAGCRAVDKQHRAMLRYTSAAIDSELHSTNATISRSRTPRKLCWLMNM